MYSKYCTQDPLRLILSSLVPARIQFSTVGDCRIAPPSRLFDSLLTSAVFARARKTPPTLVWGRECVAFEQVH
ncbi:hypothetical protein ABZX51_007993 [Aspergillus tubingensis]